MLSPEESEETRKMWAHRILRSRLLMTEKAKPLETLEEEPDPRRLSDWLVAKARWVALGHTDPDLEKRSTFAPVLSKDGFHVVLQMLASLGWDLNLADGSSAFMAGDLYDREQGPCSQPCRRRGSRA